MPRLATIELQKKTKPFYAVRMLSAEGFSRVLFFPYPSRSWQWQQSKLSGTFANRSLNILLLRLAFLQACSEDSFFSICQ
jgi:hypothetical protein